MASGAPTIMHFIKQYTTEGLARLFIYLATGCVWTVMHDGKINKESYQSTHRVQSGGVCTLEWEMECAAWDMTKTPETTTRQAFRQPPYPGFGGDIIGAATATP